MLYLISEAPPEERNFETMLYMMNFAEVREDDDQYRSPLDMLFRALEEEQPNHVAVKQYKVFKQAAGKTAKSILVSAAVRLAAFNIPQYARMTMADEMDFGSLGEKKRAIFCVIPIADTSMNYLVGMLYTQCFQELYHRADEKHGGRLPVPVRVIQDEWANVAQPESYPKILATCRSYNIGLNIIVQNIQNIKALYEKEWESIIGNCDTLLFLGGGNEPTSLEFVVKLLGKETLATRTRGQTKGRNGSSSTNFQQTGRELMTLDEVRKLGTNQAILFIRGESPVLDEKYNIKNHPNIRLTVDGKAKPYVHKPQGAPNYALPDLPYEFKSLDDYEFINMEESEHEETDYEAAKDFYVNKLGFSVIRENYRPERKDWKLDLRVNEHTELEIFAEENPPKRVNRPEACGLRHLAFCVESVEQTVNELAEVGIECEPIRVDDYTDKKMTFFHDPDGLPLELHE